MNNETAKNRGPGPTFTRVAIWPCFAITVLAIGVFVLANLKQNPLTLLVLWLDGPNLQTEIGARYVAETFYKDKDAKILRIAPFVRKDSEYSVDENTLREISCYRRHFATAEQADQMNGAG